MKLEPNNVWKSFYFSAAMSVIFVVADVAGRFATGSSHVGLTTFICFLPMAFWFAADAQRQTRQQVEALEARIRQLESDQTAT